MDFVINEAFGHAFVFYLTARQHWSRFDRNLEIYPLQAPRAWHACREAFKNLGDPAGSRFETGMQNEQPHRIRLLSHKRGNPETEAVRSLNGGNAASTRQIRSEEH